MITPAIILLVLGALFYFVSFYSPKTDIFFYAIAGVLFSLGGISGFMGYTFEIGESVTYQYTEVNNQTVILNETHSPIYSEETIFQQGLSTLQILMAMYIIMMLAVAKDDGRTRGKSEY